MKLQALKRAWAALIAESRTMLDGFGERNLTPEEQASYDAKLAEVDTAKRAIEREERQLDLERQTAAQSTPVEVTPAGGQATRKPGDAISRIVRSIASSNGDLRRAAEFCETQLRDPEVARALAAGTGTAGGFTVPENYVAEIIELLRPASVMRRMGARMVPLPGGNATFPKLTGGASASYLGENTNITKTEQTFGQLKLSAKKLAALVPISNDLIRFSSPSADGIVRDDLVSAIAQAEDLAFLRGDGLSNGPKGLRYWAPTANVLACNATVNLVNISQDLGRVQLALMEGNSRMIDPGFIMAPRTHVYLENLRDSNGNKAFPEMSGGKLLGYKYGVSNQIPTNLAVTGTAESEIFFVDFADMLIADVPGLILEASSVAAYYDGSNVVSAYSLDQTVVRVIAQHDFAPRHTGSIAVLKDVDWA